MRVQRVPLTMERIKAATCPPGYGHVLLWDALQPKLAVRVYISGRKVFVTMYRAGRGRLAPKKWLTIGEVGVVSLADARQAVTAAQGAVARGEDPAADRAEQRRRQRARLGRALDAYEVDLTRRGLVNVRHVMSLLRRELQEPLGANRDLAELARDELAARIRAVETTPHKGRAGRPGTGKKLRAVATAFLNWCAGEGLIPSNPLAGWRRPRLSKAQRLERPGRALADAELPTLWRAIGEAGDPFLAGYLKTLLLTGQRRTETALMRWSDVELGAGVWTIPAEVTKAGREHRVPLPPDLAAILAGLPRMAESKLVFPGARGRPMSGWTQRLAPIQAATAREGLRRWTLHDLRRTVRTGLGNLGVPEDIAERMLNHAPGDELAAAYDRGEYWDRRVDAASRWAKHVLGLVQEADGAKVVPLRATARE